jgi:NhaC family Na+:H+ antiporter
MLGIRRPAEPRSPSLLDCMLAVGFLIVLVAAGFLLFGEDAAYGPNQVALCVAATLAAGLAWKNGHSWDKIREAVVAGIASALQAVFILFAVGALIGTWAMSGTLVAMVYYAMGVLSPNFFYLTACIVSALVALSIGSSWTVAGTIGVGLMGIAEQMDLSPAITAGAVISGAYFGDKASPLSDTCNLAAAAAGSELFEHIRYSLLTSAPALILALVGFGLLGSPGDFDANATRAAIAARFDVTPWAFVPVLVVFGLSIARAPAYVAIILGALAGGVAAVLLQPALVARLAGEPDLPHAVQMLKGVWQALASGFKYESGDPSLDTLLNTIWLIIVALAFGSVLEHAGMLERLVAPLLSRARSTVRLVATVVATAIGLNVIAGDQYIAIVLPGRTFKSEFAHRGLRAVLLSRSLGDSATVTSPLVPWNSCGAFMAATLGVATFAYLPFAFLNLLNPIAAIVAAAFVGKGMAKPDPLSAEAAG